MSNDLRFPLRATVVSRLKKWPRETNFVDMDQFWPSTHGQKESLDMSTDIAKRLITFAGSKTHGEWLFGVRGTIEAEDG
jgi:hypothetical protein